MSDTSLVFSILAKDKATSTFKSMGSAVDKFSAVVVGAAALGAAALVKMGMVFDEAYDTIQIGTGATGAKLDALKTDFKEVFADVPVDAQIVAEALTEVAKRTGAAGAPLQDLTKQFVMLGEITGVDVTVAIENVTRAFGNWGVAVERQAAKLDLMFRASQLTGIGVDKLGELMTTFGNPLRQLGYDFDESLAMLAKWEKGGVNTEKVLAGMAKALGAAAKAGKDPQKEFAKLTAAIKGASTEAKANEIAVKSLGVKAGPEFAAAVRSGRFAYEDVLVAMRDGSATIMSTAEDTADFQEKLELLKHRGMLALEPVAMKLFDQLGLGAEKMEGLADWTGQNSDALSKWAVGIGIAVAAIVALNYAIKAYTVIATVAKGVTALFTAVFRAKTVATVADTVATTAGDVAQKRSLVSLAAHKAAMVAGAVATGIVTAAQWAWNVALYANPIGLIILAIIALVAGIYLLWTNSAGFRDFFIGMWDHIWSFMKMIGGWFAGPFADFFVKAWGFITSSFAFVRDFVINGFMFWLDMITSLRGRIASAARGLWDGIVSSFKSAINTLIRLWNNFSLTIGGGSVLGMSIPSVTLSTPDIPYLAKGGRALAPGLSVVGDDGPELAYLDRGATIQPLPQGGASGGGGSVEISGDDSRFADAVLFVIRKAIRNKGGRGSAIGIKRFA